MRRPHALFSVLSAIALPWMAIIFTLACLCCPRTFAQCGVLLQEDATIPQDAANFRCSILFDSDGPGPLPPELLVGADKGRVFAWNGTRWRQFGPPMVDPGVSYTEPSDPQVFQLLNFRGELHAVAAGSISSTNGSIFRWNGTSWIAAPRTSACGAGLLSGWFLAATVHNDEIIVAGQSLRCGNQSATALAWNGTSWRRVGDAPFTTTSVCGGLLSTSTGRLLLGGALNRSTPAQSVLITELVNNTWVTRQIGFAGGTSIAVMRLQELNGEILACGSMALNFSTPPVRVLRETPTGWERADPYNAAAVPAMEIAHNVFVDGDRTFVAGGFSDGRGAIVLLTPQAATTITLPYSGSRRLTGGIVRSHNRYFALGGTSSGADACPFDTHLLTASLADPLTWTPIPSLFSSVVGSRPIVPTIELHQGELLAANGDQPRLGLLRADCNFDSTSTVERIGPAWSMPADRLNNSVRDLLVFHDQIHAIGNFSTAGTRPLTQGLARWDGNAWQSFPVPITPASPDLFTAVVWDNRLVVADNRVGTCTIRQFDGTAWSALGPAFTAVSMPALAVANNRLFFGYASSDRVFEWNGTSWTRLGDDASTPNFITLTGYSGEILLSAMPAAGIPSVQRWTGSTWVEYGAFPLNANTVGPYVRVLREFQGTLYAGLHVNSPSTIWSSLMRLQNNAWRPAIPLPTINGATDNARVQLVYDLVPDADTLHISGEFLQLSGLPFESYARYYAGPPRILTQPAATSAVENRTAYFSIEPEVYHDPTQTYQWRKNGQPLANGPTPAGSILAGATSPYLRIQHVLPADLGDYSIIITNACASTTSPSAPLTLTCPADLDNGSFTGTPDGGVTIEDLLYYLQLFADGIVAADLDDGSGTGTPDGGVTIDDLLYFLVRFEAGC